MKSSHVREIICFALFIVLLGGPRSVYSTGELRVFLLSLHRKYSA